MGQSEIIAFLGKQKRPISRKEIADGLNYDVTKTSHIIQKLLKHNEIKCIEIDRIVASKLFNGKPPCRRMKLYYCFDLKFKKSLLKVNDSS